MYAKRHYFNGIDFLVEYDENNNRVTLSNSGYDADFDKAEKIPQIKWIRTHVETWGNVNRAGLKATKDFVDSYYADMAVKNRGLSLRYDEHSTQTIHVQWNDEPSTMHSLGRVESILEDTYGFNADQARNIVGVVLAAGTVNMPTLTRLAPIVEWDIMLDRVKQGTLHLFNGSYFFGIDTYNMGEKSVAIRFPDFATVRTYLVGRWSVAGTSIDFDSVRYPF